MAKPWNEDVRGTQVLPLINSDADTIRAEAGPGTGKTFGLVRRVQRILHPNGLAMPGREVLIVAFNRVIAKQLRTEIDRLLEDSPHDGDPVIRTVHALCLDVIGTQPRLLLDHEREAMLYDVLEQFPALRKEYKAHKNAEQALRDHEAKHKLHPALWQGVQTWLSRHHAQLISDLPGMLLDRLDGGDFMSHRYQHVIVDEFQDLTAGEQQLFLKLRRDGGSFLALGDPRQSIYAFRGNDREGLDKLEELVQPSKGTITDVEMTECQRCPSQIVAAANQLMGLSASTPMVPTSKAPANMHVVVWQSPAAEAEGMAQAIVMNIKAHPKDRHLAMATRRQFGYALRERVAALDGELNVELSFSESLLETWAVREGFLFFCLLVDPDAPTWRAWLGYQNSSTGKGYKAPSRNAPAYLSLLAASHDEINDSVIEAVARREKKPSGTGGKNVWERAQRFIKLRAELSEGGGNAEAFVAEIFNPDMWITTDTEDAQTARLDMQLCFDKTNAILQDVVEAKPKWKSHEHLAEVARRLRYQIATREPFETGDAAASLQIATLWGAKGVTADHVYVLGLCGEALPGERRDEYPGTDTDYQDEQRRLFYVSITRSKKTLVLSRARRINRGEAKRLGLSVGLGFGQAKLTMSPFLRDIMNVLPKAVDGESWPGSATVMP